MSENPPRANPSETNNFEGWSKKKIRRHKARQRNKKIAEIREEIWARVHASCAVCERRCGNTLPYLGYPHGCIVMECIINGRSLYRPPSGK